MKTKFIKVSEEAKQDLRNANITENRLDLVGQCKKYAELKKLFSEIGVVWNKKDKTHYLQEGAYDQIQFILNGGQIVDDKRTYQAFFTPANLAARVVELANVNGMDCLEPSCGCGNLVKEMIVQGAKNVSGIELNGELERDLQKLSYPNFKYSIPSDFLNMVSGEWSQFDRIVMNPPFSNNQDIRHVEHALNFLSDGGRLVAIMSGNTQRDSFKKLLCDKKYRIENVPEGAFRESGTMVKVIILIIDK